MPISNARPRLFISYARSDGEDFATALRRQLETEHTDLPVWQDRERMRGGVGWQKQIEDALNQVMFMVLIATPGAFESENVLWEWDYAKQQGVCICPILVPTAATNPDELPNWMRNIRLPEEKLDFDSLPQRFQKPHYYDLTREWSAFTRFLETPCQQTRVPFMAGGKHDGERFVERPAKYKELTDFLLTQDSENPIATKIALRGTGGFGKTTLALALCHDEKVRNAFDDGILWVTLDENPNLAQKLSEMYIALTGRKPAYSTPEGIASALAEKLERKSCLIVIDDVFKITDLRPFLLGGDNCARLITTRDAQIAGYIGAEQIEIGEMLPDEAVKMLVRGLEPTPDNLEPFRELAAHLGEWPQLLDLTNGTIREYIVQRNDSIDSALVHI